MVMYDKVIIHSRFKVDVDIPTDRRVEVYIDGFSFRPLKGNEIRIIVLEEPLVDTWYHLVREFPEYYTYVFTFQDQILRENPKAVHFRCADIWCRGYHPTDKRFVVSTVVGGKRDPRMPGYALRHQLWYKQQEIIMPKAFYLSDSNKWDEADYDVCPVLYGSKDKMFDFMFHIAIENCSIKHYYSEKLLDCIETKTVPIYYGCTNIGDYFNTDGIIIVKNVADIVRECNKLTPQRYKEMKPALDDNFNRIQGLPNYDGQLKRKLEEVLNKN